MHAVVCRRQTPMPVGLHHQVPLNSTKGVRDGVHHVSETEFCRQRSSRCTRQAEVCASTVAEREFVRAVRDTVACVVQAMLPAPVASAAAQTESECVASVGTAVAY